MPTAASAAWSVSVAVVPVANSKTPGPKASVDSILGVFGVGTDDVGNIINQKLDIVERNLVEQTNSGVFPILGYSYFEYANSLKESDPYSALLYSEYALELSNLDIYFKTADGGNINMLNNIDKNLLIVFTVGVILGVIISRIIGYKPRKKGAKRKKS